MATGSDDEVNAPDPAGVLTARGLRTRAALVAAARELFETQGYLDTNVNDISSRAKVAYGTFYIYFSSKEDVFNEVVKDFYAQFRAIAASEPHPGADPVARIERTNRGFLRAYRETAPMQALLEQVASFNPRLALARRESNRYWRDRARRAITGWQIDGVVDRRIDAVYAASALGSMVERFAYVWFVMGESYDFEQAVEQITHLYCNALGIRHELTHRDP